MEYYLKYYNQLSKVAPVRDSFTGPFSPPLRITQYIPMATLLNCYYANVVIIPSTKEE